MEQKDTSDFMENVLSLDETSSREQILHCLLWDMKQLACLSERKTEVFTDMCAGAGLAVSLRYALPNTGPEALKNWLRYKIASDRKLYQTPFDGDTSAPVLAAFQALLGHVSAEAVYAGGRRFSVKLTKDAPVIELETDTVNSLATTFGEFLREVLTKDGVEADYAANYKSAFGLSEKTYDRSLLYAYCLARLDEWYESPRLTDEGRLIFDAFIKLAERSHVMGNFALVPAGYNMGRYPRSKDYWDLTLRDLRNFYFYTSNFSIFDSFDGSTASNFSIPTPVSEGFELFGGHDFDSPIPKRENMRQCLENMTRLIEVRGLNMLVRLNPALAGNVSFAEMTRRAKKRSCGTAAPRSII